MSRLQRFWDGFLRWRDTCSAAAWLFAANLAARGLASAVARTRGGRRFVDSRASGWLLAVMLTRNLRAWQATLEMCYFDVVRSALLRLEAVGVVDRFIAYTVRNTGADATYVIEVSGWAGEPIAPSGHVEIHFGGQIVARVRPSLPRPDLRAFFGLGRTPNSGFTAAFTVSGNLATMGPSGYSATFDGTDGRRYAVEIADGLSSASMFTCDSSEEERAGYIDDVKAFRREPFAPESGWVLIRAGGMAPVLWSRFLIDAGFIRVAKALVWFNRTDALTSDPTWADLMYRVRADAAAERSLESGFSRAGAQPILAPGVRNIVRVWRDAREWLNYLELAAGTTMSVQVPVVFEAEETAGTAVVPVPAMGIHTVQGASVLPRGVVVRGPDLVVVEPGADPASDFVAGQWSVVAGSVDRPDAALVWSGAERETSVNRAVLLSTRVPENHFHFLIENLSRMYPLIAAGIEPMPLLVSKRINAACRSALDVCAPGWPITWLDDDIVVRVDELLVPTFPTNHPDTTVKPWIHGSALSYPFMTFLRERLLPLVDPSIDTPDYVYLERRGTTARSLLNAQDVSEAARSRAFVSVDPGTLSMAEQITVFSRAKVIAGVGGAAFANLVFASPGTQIVALVSDQLHDFCMQSELARFAGADFMYVTGPSPGSRFDVAYHREFFHKPFSIDPKKFGRALDQAVAAVNG